VVRRPCGVCPLENAVVGAASVPSGASTGEHGAVELRDGEKTRDGWILSRSSKLAQRAAEGYDALHGDGILPRTAMGLMMPTHPSNGFGRLSARQPPPSR
jgi:hypothetical protein